jgi:phage tail-like protein
MPAIWDDYPLPAFHFQVRFTNPMLSDTSFQEVTGLAHELDTEEVVEGGENRFVHHLPKGAKNPKLVLKRAVAGASSPLVRWCKATLEGGFHEPLQPKNLLVFLLDEIAVPVRIWDIENAYPVNWEVESFGATKNEVAIEKIELVYNTLTRWV